MSRTDTWMPLFVGDYLADTGRLTTLGHGAYLLILMDYWRNGPPADSDSVLSAIARVERKTWDRELKDTIRSFFVVGDDGLLHQKRLDHERKRAAELSEKRRIAASQRGATKATTVPSGGSNSSAIAPAIAEQEPDLLVTHARVAIPSPSQTQRKNPHLPAEDVPPRQDKGCRLPDGWEPTQELREFAIVHSLRPDAIAERFRDYWRAQPGTKGRKADWDATWRNWCRREAESPQQPKPTLKSRMAWMFNEDGSMRPPEDFMN